MEKKKKKKTWQIFKSEEKRVQEYGGTIEIKDVTEEAGLKNPYQNLGRYSFDKIENNDSWKVKRLFPIWKGYSGTGYGYYYMIGKVLKRRSVGIKATKTYRCISVFGTDRCREKHLLPKDCLIICSEMSPIWLDSIWGDTAWCAKSVNKLIGASAGYIGYNREEFLRNCKEDKYCIVLLDERNRESIKRGFNMFYRYLTMEENIGQ